MKTVGIIGIGMMGHGIATNIQKAGYQLGVLEHPGNQPLDELLAGGAKVYQTAAELAADSEVILLCVTGTPQVEAVLLQAGGVLDGIKEGTVVIDCSTAVPSSTEKIARQVESKGGRFIDAPMTRTPREAAEGRLNLLVGGDVSLIEEIRPLLSSFAENIAHAGDVGAGHRMKLIHNYVSLGAVALIAEAAACAAKSNIDPAVLVDVLSKGGGAGVALDRVTPYLLRQDSSALRFAMSNAEKDMNYYTVMAKESGSALEIGEAIRSTYAKAARLDPTRFAPELVQILADA